MAGQVEEKKMAETTTGELLAVTWEEELKGVAHRKPLPDVMKDLLKRYHAAPEGERSAALVSLLATWVEDPLGPFHEQHEGYVKMRCKLLKKRIRSVEQLAELVAKGGVVAASFALARLAADVAIPRHIRVALQAMDVDEVKELVEAAAGGCFRCIFKD
jgi:DNA-binding protein Fis